MAYDRFGHGPGLNLGHAQVEQSEESRAWWWGGWIADMGSFFGWDGLRSGGGRVCGAPEQCREEEGNDGPCAGRHVDSVPAMLLRFVMDRWGAADPGGEDVLIRKLTSSSASGFSSLDEVSGSPIERVLAEFYIALWVTGASPPTAVPGLDGLVVSPRRLEPHSRRLPAVA